MSVAQINLGNLHRVQGNLEQTRECYAQAIVIYRALGSSGVRRTRCAVWAR